MELKLFAVLLGGRPDGCTVEQHNVFFGVAHALENLYPSIKCFWNAAPKIHIDAYVQIEQVGDYNITPIKKTKTGETGRGDKKLFFVNLGGYQEGEFEEVHKKLFVIATDQVAAVNAAKSDLFFQKGMREGKATPHIDDKLALEEFDEDAPIDVGVLVKPHGYLLSIQKVREGSTIYPKPIILGFHRIP